jgi:hypothetical protein
MDTVAGLFWKRENPDMFNVPYSTDTIRIPNVLAPGNETSDSALEFDIAPAWGADLARLKSIVIALTGTADDRDLNSGNWSPEIQKAVIQAFETGAPAFINTVTAIRNLAVPGRMALRAGLVTAIDPKNDQPVAVKTGEAFSRICGHSELTGIALFLALKIVTLSGQQNIDPRFFVQPSGSISPGMPEQKTSSVNGARKRSRRPGTADASGKTDSQPAGISQPNG